MKGNGGNPCYLFRFDSIFIRTVDEYRLKIWEERIEQIVELERGSKERMEAVNIDWQKKIENSRVPNSLDE